MVCLMITVAVTTTDVELWRFAQAQKGNLGRLMAVYIDGLSSQVLIRETPWLCPKLSIVRKAISTLASNRAMQSWRYLTGRS